MILRLINSDGGGEKRLNFGYILKVELLGFLIKFDLRMLRKRWVKDNFKNFGFVSRRMQWLIIEMGQSMRNKFQGDDYGFSFGYIKF